MGSSPIKVTTKIYCAVEKLVSREAHNLKIGGSSPSCATKIQVNLVETECSGNPLVKAFKLEGGRVVKCDRL